MTSGSALPRAGDMTLTLSPGELRELTAKRRSDAQARVLDYMQERTQ